MENLSVIVAVTSNGVIGRDDRLPWRLATDLRRFKRLTMGHHLIMGRRTFESIGRPLPGRTTIVVTRKPQSWAGVLVANSLHEAYRMVQGDREAFIVGGGQIYAQAMADAKRLYMTIVHAEVDGDTTFPNAAWEEWKLIEEEQCAADERNTYATTFRVFCRVEKSD